MYFKSIKFYNNDTLLEILLLTYLNCARPDRVSIDQIPETWFVKTVINSLRHNHHQFTCPEFEFHGYKRKTEIVNDYYGHLFNLLGKHRTEV